MALATWSLGLRTVERQANKNAPNVVKITITGKIIFLKFVMMLNRAALVSSSFSQSNPQGLMLASKSI